MPSISDPAPAGLPLRIDGLRVTAPGGRTLLEVASFALEAGTSLGIRGPSGAGKSTLLHALAGLASGVAGRVLWGDTDLAALPPRARGRFRAARMGFVFQDFLLFEELSARDNAALIAMFAPRAARATLRAAATAELARLGLHDSDRGVATFSGGERQRVAVARALAARPAILLADEPTAALHREAADALVADLTRDTGARTLVAVSHDPHLLAAMDRVVTLEDGRIVLDEGA